MRMAIAVVACAVLAGCQGAEEAPAREESATSPNAAQKAEAPFFVGQWATEEALCANAAWEFTENRISTPGHVVCTFDNLEQAGSAYEADATCTAEGPPQEYRIKISYAQSAGALLVEGAPFEPIGLVACD